ncbi:MAG: hypothetical protein ACI4P6_05325 [Candidatus Spyradosoma sp.]
MKTPIYFYDYSEKWVSDADRWRPKTPPGWVQDIPFTLQEKFADLASRSAAWTPDDYIGGMETHDGNVSFFRVFNGGHDRDNRSRWVLLVMVLPCSHAKASSLKDVLECDVFRDYAKEKSAANGKTVPDVEPQWKRRSAAGIDVLLEKESGEGAEGTRIAEKYSLGLTSSDDFNGSVLIEKFGEDVRAEAKTSRKEKSFETKKLESENASKDVISKPDSSQKQASHKASKKGKIIGVIIIALLVVDVITFFFVFLAPIFKSGEPYMTICDKENSIVIIPDFQKESGSDLPVSYGCPLCNGIHHYFRKADLKHKEFKFEELPETLKYDSTEKHDLNFENGK